MATDKNEFPPLNHLGYGLDLTTLNPISVNGVVSAIKGKYATVDVFQASKTHDVQIGDATYKGIPTPVAVIQDIQEGSRKIAIYESGAEASSSFSVDASLSVTYGGLSGSASANYAYNNSFKKNMMFALFSFSYDVYQASLRNYGNYVDEDGLAKGMKKLKYPFDHNDADCVKRYKSFFATRGSHIIIGASYGSRFQLNIRQNNEESDVKKSWGANVKAAYSGVVDVNADVSVKSEDQYKSFSKNKLEDGTARGGDQKLAGTLQRDPSSKDAFDAWLGSALSYPDVTNLVVTEIWTLMADADNDDLSKYSTEVQKAFNWIMANPEQHLTIGTLTIESDWAEFGVLSPKAYIEPGPDKDGKKRTWKDWGVDVGTDLKFTWGKEHSHDYKREIIKFVVINDGSPIDFYIAHGSSGGGEGKGKATVTLENTPYVADTIVDNNWNIKHFYQAPVSGTPAPDDD